MEGKDAERRDRDRKRNNHKIEIGGQEKQNKDRRQEDRKTAVLWRSGRQAEGQS